jgi:alpha-D-ribose 1-methylphosphonate 5-triphosphate synthase subunit PhnI
VDVPVEGGTEAMDEAHRPKAGRRAGAAALAQMGLDDAQQDMQHGADRPRLAPQIPAQP